MSKSAGARARDDVVSVLVAARREARLTQREVVERLPEWLGWYATTIAKAEKGRRGLDFIEVREYAKVVGITIATVDRRATALAAGHDHRAPAMRRPRKG